MADIKRPAFEITINPPFCDNIEESMGSIDHFAKNVFQSLPLVVFVLLIGRSTRPQAGS